MNKCDCCGDKRGNGKSQTQKVPRRPNYQKLIDVSLPVYIPPLGHRLKEDGERNSEKGRCKRAITGRRGEKMSVPMPCRKFTPKEDWEKLIDQRGNASPGKEEMGEARKAEIIEPIKEDQFQTGNPCTGGITAKSGALKNNDKVTVCMPSDSESFQKPSKKPEPPRERRLLKPSSRQEDYKYRCESRELLGSKLLINCECVKRNGIQDQCPRTPCRGRPACLVKPWPDCWPSGGCYGQDYNRVNGVARVNPSLQYRQDNKKCGPASNGERNETSDDSRSDEYQQVKIVMESSS